MPIMPELGRLKQEYYKTFKATLRYIHEFQGSLDYIVRTRLKLRKKIVFAVEVTVISVL